MTPSSRTRHRTAIAAVGAGIALIATSVAPALATAAKHPKPAKPVRKDQPVVAGARYLALGDSVSFGYRESNAIPKPNDQKPKSIVGYPEDVAANLGLKLTNAACPGETSASFINTSAQSNGCENIYSASGPIKGGYRTTYPLHTKYKNAKQSQLAFAEAYLKKHPDTRLVTFMIGANDGFLCVQQTTDGCRSEFADLQAKITKNVHKILKGLRKTAHYRGQIALLTYYSTNYSDFLSTYESTGLNNALEKAAKPFDVRVADGFGQFKKDARQTHGDTCAAQLLTQLSAPDQGTCGVHPSLAGQALLAQAVEQAIKK
jgi:lysophospholipase L1-like esterase